MPGQGEPQDLRPSEKLWMETGPAKVPGIDDKRAPLPDLLKIMKES